MINFSQYQSKTFWFDRAPELPTAWLRYYLIFFGIITIFGVLSYFNRFLFPKIKAKFIAFFLTTGLVGLFLVFLRFEGIVVLSSRLFWLILLLAAAIWKFTILYYLIFIYPKEMKALQDFRQYQSYLPKKKSR